MTAANQADASFVVSRSEAKDLLGDDWVQIQRRVVQQHANQYKRISWSKVYYSIIDYELVNVSGKVYNTD
jgi:hypothetical protein